MRRTSLFVLACLGAWVLPADADEVLLHSGGRLQGIAAEEGDDVVVETVYGKVRISREMVLSIDRSKRSKVEEYYEKLDETDLEKPEEVEALARWSRMNGLSKHAKELYKTLVELEPDHETARRELGFSHFQGRWMTPEEVMMAKGFVRHRDKWLTPAERELIVKAELEETYRKEEERRKREEARRVRRQDVPSKRPEWERVSEIYPVISTGGRRDSSPASGGYGIHPSAGLVLTYDFRTYIEQIYKAHTNVAVPPHWYWPFVRPTP